MPTRKSERLRDVVCAGIAAENLRAIESIPEIGEVVESAFIIKLL